MEILVNNYSLDLPISEITKEGKKFLARQLFEKGVPASEIAAALQVPRRTVSSWRPSAMAEMREELPTENLQIAHEETSDLGMAKIHEELPSKICEPYPQEIHNQDVAKRREELPSMEPQITHEENFDIPMAEINVELPHVFPEMSEEEEQAIFRRIAANTKHLRRPTEQEIRNKWLPESQKDSHFKQNGTYNLKISAARPKNPLLDFSWRNN